MNRGLTFRIPPLVLGSDTNSPTPLGWVSCDSIQFSSDTRYMELVGTPHVEGPQQDGLCPHFQRHPQVG